MDIPDIKSLKQGQYSETSIKKQYPEFYKFIVEKYKHIHIDKFSELLYLYFHNMNEPPKCSMCGKQLSLINYSKGYRTYCSKKCMMSDESIKEKIKQTHIEKYGVEHPSKLNEIKEKIKQTCLEKYGVDNPSKLNEIKEKRKQTCLEKYGVEYPQSLDDIKEKIKQTCLEKYGVEYASQTHDAKEKSKQTCLEKYGVEYVSQTKEFRESVKRTCLDKYGAECSLQSSKIKEKSKQTLINKYGVDNIAKLQETTKKKKQTCLDKYGAESYSQTHEFKEKYKQTMLKNYGVKSYFQSNEYKSKIEDIISKIYQTKKLRKSFNSSKIEKEFKKWLEDNHINYKYQYKSKDYPFNCDFYFPDKKLYLEIQGYFTHGDHPYDLNNPVDNILLQKLKEHNYHNIVKIWSIKDPLKRETAIKNNLNWIEVFTSDVNVLINKVKDLI